MALCMLRMYILQVRSDGIYLESTVVIGCQENLKVKYILSTPSLGGGGGSAITEEGGEVFFFSMDELDGDIAGEGMGTKIGVIISTGYSITL